MIVHVVMVLDRCSIFRLQNYIGVAKQMLSHSIVIEKPFLHCFYFAAIIQFVVLWHDGLF